MAPRKITLEKDEIGLMIDIIADLAPDNYLKNPAKALIYKARQIREETGTGDGVYVRIRMDEVE